MVFDYDATGVQVNDFSGFDPLPENKYDLQVIDFKEQLTKNGDQMVNVTLEVVESIGGFNGRKVWHNIVFLPKEHKAAGIAIHWLKCIGEPFEGKLSVSPEKWIGKRVRAHVVIEKYVGKDGQGKLKNSIKSLEKVQEEDVPF